MRNKMLTLDPTSYEWASKHRNFSRWVRERINDEINGDTIEVYTKELDRMSQLLTDIIEGRRKWVQGCGWVFVDED